MVSIPGSDLYWAVGAWGDCSQDCIQTRLVACYFKSGDGSGSPTSTQESQCLESGTAKPVAARSCEPDECAVNTEGVLRRNLPLIVGLATGMGVLVGKLALVCHMLLAHVILLIGTCTSWYLHIPIPNRKFRGNSVHMHSASRRGFACVYVPKQFLTSVKRPDRPESFIVAFTKYKICHSPSSCLYYLASKTMCTLSCADIPV